MYCTTVCKTALHRLRIERQLWTKRDKTVDYSRANRSVPKNVDQFIENPNFEEFL
jgi:hypothetical protein